MTIALSNDHVRKLSCVVKTGPRAVEQGRFLLELNHRVPEMFPEVYGISEVGYVMEELQDVEITDATMLAALVHMKTLSLVPNAGWQWNVVNFLNYLQKRWAHVQLPPLVWDRFCDAVLSHRNALFYYPNTVSHGDFTLDNIMWRPGSNTCVLIDPLPPHDGSLPGYLNDVGKWELSLRWHGRKNPTAYEIPTSLLDVAVAAHALRVLPYAVAANNGHIVHICRGAFDAFV